MAEDEVLDVVSVGSKIKKQIEGWIRDEYLKKEWLPTCLQIYVLFPKIMVRDRD